MAKSKSGSKSADTGTGAVVEDIGPSRKKITITIPGDEVSQTLDASLATVTAEAVLPGFRPGRVPARLIEKRFGGAVKDEAKKQLVSTAYSRAVEEHKLRVLGEPEGAEELATLELQPGKEVKFTVEVEVPPTFELPSLDGIPVNRPVIEVQEKDIDAFIDRLKVNEGKLEPREQAEAGDYAIGNGVMKTSDGEVVHDIQGAVIQIPPAEAKGEGAILGVKVDDFGKQVGLPKVGDTLKVKATGPEHHENAKIRGKKLDTTFEVTQINRIVPATTEELVSKFGLADEAQLRESVKMRLEHRARIEQQMAMRAQISSHFTDSIKMELPEKLTERQAARNLERTRLNLLYRGFDARQVEEKITEMRSSSAQAAVRELKLFFVLAEAADRLKIQVTEDEVNGRIAQIAMERGMRPEQLRNELIQRGQGGMVVQQVREHKTLDAILAKAKVTDMPVDKFNEMMNKKKEEGVSLA